MAVGVAFDRGAVTDLCRRHHIRELALFGSVLREDFGPDSDVDVLVDFEPGHAPGLFGLVSIQDELGTIFGRPVDLVTRPGLSPYIRDRVEASRSVQYLRESGARPGLPEPSPDEPWRGKDDALYLHHILDAAVAALRHVEGFDAEAFRADAKTQDAVVRQLEILGEASRHVSAAFRAGHPEVPWSGAAAMRNRLIHGYFEVDLHVVWRVVRHELPMLVERMRSILS